jgi:hypothetical protein
MAKDSTYVVGPKNLLKNLTGDNLGAVMTSNDGTLMLLENVPAKFESLVGQVPLVTMMTESEAQDYKKANLDEWKGLEASIE